MDLGFRFDAVWVLESLRPGEPRTGEALFDDVIVPCASAYQRIHTFYRRVLDRQHLFAILAEAEEQARSFKRWPILHLETHAGPSGLELGNNDVVSWSELTSPLTAINLQTRLNLVVTVAACSGVEIHRALHLIDRAPFLYITGPKDRREAGQLRLDFGLFYREFLSSFDMRRAFGLLNGNNPPAGWTYPVVSAEHFFKRVFEDYLSTDCSLAELTARENAIVAGIARQRGLDLLDLAGTREQVRRDLRQQEQYFLGFRRQFFMIDLYPENDSRFTVKWADFPLPSNLQAK